MDPKATIDKMHPTCQAVIGLATDLETCLREISQLPPAPDKPASLQDLIDEHKGKSTFSDYYGVNSARITRNRITHRKPHEAPLAIPEVERAKKSLEDALRDLLSLSSFPESLRDKIKLPIVVPPEPDQPVPPEVIPPVGTSWLRSRVFWACSAA